MSHKTNKRVRQLEMNIRAWELCITSEELKIRKYKGMIYDAKLEITKERRKIK